MKAAFVTLTIPNKKPEIISLYSTDILTETEIKKHILKSISKKGGEEGEFISVIFHDYQIASVLALGNSINNKSKKEEKYVSLGVVLSENENPLPYRNMFLSLVKQFREQELMDLACFKQILPGILKISEEKEIEIEIKDKRIKLKLEGDVRKRSRLEILNDALWGIL